MNNQFTYPKEKIRFAILTFFFAQGLCMASWASRIPDFKDVFAANYAFYWGLILFMIPVGKFVAIPLAGYLVSKLGSRTMVQVSILGYDFSSDALFCSGIYHRTAVAVCTQGKYVSGIVPLPLVIDRIIQDLLLSDSGRLPFGKCDYSGTLSLLQRILPE